MRSTQKNRVIRIFYTADFSVGKSEAVVSSSFGVK